MANDLTLHMRLTADADGLQGEVRVSREELERLNRTAGKTGTAAQDAARGLNRTGHTARRMSQQVGRGSDQMTRMQAAAGGLQQALAPLIAAMSAGAVARFATQSIAATAALSEQADVAGITTERYQELVKAFGDLGGVAEDITSGALRRFNRRLGLAQEGAGAGAKAFEEMGTSLRSGTQQALDETIEYLAGVEDESRRAALASQVFGEDAGPKMGAVLAQGTAAIQAQIEQIREQGRVLSNETAAGARQANDQLNEMRDIISTEFNRRIAENAESITTLGRAMATLAGWTVKAADAFVKFGEGLGIGVAKLVEGDPAAELQSRIEGLDTQIELLTNSANMFQGVVARLEGKDALSEGQTQYLERARAEYEATRQKLRALRQERQRLIEQQSAITIDITGGREALDDWILGLGQVPPALDEVVAATRGASDSRDDNAQTTAEAAAAEAKYQAQLQAVLSVVDPVGQAAKEYGNQVQVLRKAQERGRITTEEYAEFVAKLAEEYQASINPQDNFAQKLQAVLDAANPAAAAAREYASQVHILREAVERGRITNEEYEKSVGNLAKELQGATDKTKEFKDTQREVPQIVQDTASGIRGAFRDTFRDVFDEGIDGFKDFGSRILDVFKDILAEMATLAIARPVIVPVVQAMGGAMGVDPSQTQSVLGELGGSGSGGGMDWSQLASGFTQSAGLGVAGLGSTMAGYVGGGGFFSGMAGAGAAYSAGGSAAAQGVMSSLGSSAAGWGATAGTALSGAAAASPYAAVAGLLAQELLGGKSGIGASTGVTAGAAIGSVIPGVGTLIGGIVGGLLGAVGGSFLGDKTDPRIAFKNEKAGTPSSAFEDDVSVSTPFGELGLSNATHKTDAEDYKPLLDGLAEFDRIIAKMADEGEVQKVSDALSDWRSSIQEWDDAEAGDITRLLQERYSVVFGELGGQASRMLERFTLGFEGSVDDFLARVTTLGQSLNGLDELLEDPARAQAIVAGWATAFEGDNTAFGQQAQGMVQGLARVEGYRNEGALAQYQAAKDEANRSLNELYNEQVDKAREAAEAFDGSYESTVELGNQVEILRQRELSMLQAIDAAQQQVTQRLSASAERIRQDLMGEEERYQYLRNQAEGLAQSLKSMTNPERIAQTAEQIRELTMQGYNLLSDEQQQSGMGEELAKFLDQVQETANERLDERRETIDSNADKIATTIDDRLGAVADRYDKAAEAMERAMAPLGGAMASFADAVGDFGEIARQPVDVRVQVDTEAANDTEVD
ncbi:hypothetical protein [Arhodomonas sp. AD133]|uniref:hypothetical protein n=1 Tax=Arhodomonas sp. AD133 TaxID=3415009 RepID=UPI003EB8280D